MTNIFTLKIKQNEVYKTIKEAAIAGIVVAVASLLIVLFLMPPESALIGYIEVAAIFLLSIGILFKSRITAMALLVYFVLSKIYLFVLFLMLNNIIGAAGQIVVGLIFIMYFLRGAKATFVYHTHFKK